MSFLLEAVAVPFRIAFGVFRWWLGWPLWLHYPLLPIYVLLLLLLVMKIF